MIYIVKKELTLEEFLRMFLVDEDGGVRLERTVVSPEDGLPHTAQITIVPEPPDFESTYRIELRAIA